MLVRHLSYKDTHRHANSSIPSYRYTCTQLNSRQKKSQKVDNASKQRDEAKVATFACKGLVALLIYIENPQYVNVTITHCLDHAPHCSDAVPSDVRELVAAKLDLSMSKAWDISL